MAAVRAEALSHESVNLRVTGGDGFAGYVCGELGNERSTAWTYEQSLLRLERVLGKDRWLLTAADIRCFFRTTDYHPSTKNGALVAIRALMRFGLLEKRVRPEQAMEIINMRGPKKRRHRPKKPFSLEEVHVLLDACRTSNEFRLVYCGLYQGLRISDLAALREENVLADRLDFISVKYRKPLELPLHDELARVMPKILKRKPTRGSLVSTCRSLSYYTGIPFSSHRFRATFSRRIDDLGVQEGVAIELLGHEQVTVYRRHYAEVSWKAMVDAIALHGYGEYGLSKRGTVAEGEEVEPNESMGHRRQQEAGVPGSAGAIDP